MKTSLIPIGRVLFKVRYILNHGFTLIELLVVIAIIGILASLLLPSLTNAKGRAHETICINNLHQIGIAMNLYKDDHETRFPPAFVQNKNPVTGEVLGIVDARWTLGGKSPKGEHMQKEYLYAESRPLHPYIKTAETFRCPADKGVAVQSCSCPRMTETKWDALGCSYHYNAGGLTAISGSTVTRVPQMDAEVGLAGKKEDWVPDPSRHILVHEPPARPWGCPGQPAIWEQWHRSQGRSEYTDPTIAPKLFVSPILFVDGHAKIHNFTKALTADPLYPYEPTKDWSWYRPADNALGE